MSAANDRADTQSENLASLCSDAGGWDFETRADGSLSVDLGVHDGFVAARVAHDGSEIAVEATLVETLPEAGPTREALDRLMLRANACFRGVRGLVTTGEGESRALFEVRIARNARASELSRALGAVAIATRHCALEAEALVADERLARLYLSRLDPDHPGRDHIERGNGH